jgi:hypothetical protein
MKLFCAFALAALSVAAAVSPQLKQVNAVYILAMSGGMDQYLANQLTAAGVFQVVTDPQKADAILTDRLGEPFETKLKELYPPPPAPKQEGDASKPDDKSKGPDFGGGAVRVGSSSSNRGKGNFFLVDRRTRAVLWSVYEPAKDSDAGTMTKVAAKIVKRLMGDLSDKKSGD